MNRMMRVAQVAMAGLLVGTCTLAGCGDDGDSGGASGAAGAGAGGTGSAGAGGTAGSAGAGGSSILPSNPFALRIFFSDLLSGPNTGGQNNLGAFVTAYGRGFGDTQGPSSVTVGGGAVDHVIKWTDSRITFQLGAQLQTGNIVVNVDGKGVSNGIPFTVRAGAIYFVGPSGDDQNDGSYEHPWNDLAFAKSQLAPGDILYALDGTSATTLDGTRAALCIADGYGCDAQQGTPDQPIAIVA